MTLEDLNNSDVARLDNIQGASNNMHIQWIARKGQFVASIQNGSLQIKREGLVPESLPEGSKYCVLREVEIDPAQP
jgi:hypothetical protein